MTIIPTICRLLSLSMATAIATTSGYARETPPPTATATTLPAQRTLTDTTGRKIDVIITSKTTTAIKATRASDGKEFTFELAKLSADDRAFVANADLKKNTPVVLSKTSKTNIQVAYGQHLILRIPPNTFAVEINARPSKDAVDLSDKTAYAISYTIRRSSKVGRFETIKEGDAKEARPSNGDVMLACTYFKLQWSAGGAGTGWLYLKSLPEGTEFHGEQLASLENFDTQIDPAKWVKLTK